MGPSVSRAAGCVRCNWTAVTTGHGTFQRGLARSDPVSIADAAVGRVGVNALNGAERERGRERQSERERQTAVGRVGVNALNGAERESEGERDRVR